MWRIYEIIDTFMHRLFFGSVEEPFYSAIHLAKTLIAISEPGRISLYFDKFVFIRQFSIVDLISEKSFFQIILDHWSSIDKAFAHPFVFKVEEIVIFVIVAGRVHIMKGFIMLL